MFYIVNGSAKHTLEKDSHRPMRHYPFTTLHDIDLNEQ